MARPIKEHANWFRHDADASSDEKLLYIESLFGLKGYAFYFKMLEILTRSDGFEIKLSTLKTPIYAKKIGVSVDDFNEMIKATTDPELAIFVLTDDQTLYSNGLKKRLEPLLNKRERDRNRQSDVSASENKVSDSENAVNAGESPKRREEQSTVEKSTKEQSREEQKETADLPFENLFTALLALLAEHDKSKHQKASISRRLKAESLFQKYEPEFLSEKMIHFKWVMKHKPALAGRSPTGFFINSVEGQYPPPAGFEEWQEEQLRHRRKKEDDHTTDEAYREYVKNQISESLNT